MKKSRFTISALVLMLLSVSQVNAQSLLKDYDDKKATHTMSCWTGQTGRFKYEIKGKEVHVNNSKVGDIIEQKGKIFATKMSSMLGPITLILDYKNKKVTQKSGLGNEVFECR